ncbi:MAG: DUF3465 domain-containing protein [Actinobacteria bacterium]|nr:DUF3465 domain-containing protein [Actinomycetota bacterium]
MSDPCPSRPAVALAAAMLAVALLALAGCGGSGGAVSDGAAPASDDSDASARDDAVLAAAFEDRAHDLQVQGGGTVVTLLADDTDGDRHQRFVIRLESGQTLLVAHNIDVAPRVEGLAVGDAVAFRGVYEWSEQGGTIHWTHQDPDGRHAAGWLRHDGQTYQ